MKTTIVLVDDHETFRRGLRALLDGEPDLVVVGEAAEGRVGVEVARALSPDLVVMDLVLPDVSGFEAIRRMRAGGDRAFYQSGQNVVCLDLDSGREVWSESAPPLGVVYGDRVFCAGGKAVTVQIETSTTDAKGYVDYDIVWS